MNKEGERQEKKAILLLKKWKEGQTKISFPSHLSAVSKKNFTETLGVKPSTREKKILTIHLKNLMCTLLALPKMIQTQ